MSQFFASGDQSIRVSASTSVLPMNIRDWFPLGWTGWISLQSRGLSRVFSSTTVNQTEFQTVFTPATTPSGPPTWPPGSGSERSSSKGGFHFSPLPAALTCPSLLAASSYSLGPMLCPRNPALDPCKGRHPGLCSLSLPRCWPPGLVSYVSWFPWGPGWLSQRWGQPELIMRTMRTGPVSR